MPPRRGDPPGPALPQRAGRILGRVQRGLEELYRVVTGVEVHDFVVDEQVRDGLGTARRPREQLLVSQAGGEVGLALFVDEGVLDTLHRHDPGEGLGEHNFGDFLLALEGVSHFVYAVFCARHARPVSALELELQAEVDKYVTCLLMGEASAEVSAALRRRLFAEPAYEPDLDEDEAHRYRLANDSAHRYAAHLEASYVGPRRVPAMLGELRRFYRRSLPAKLETIARAA